MSEITKITEFPSQKRSLYDYGYDKKNFVSTHDSKDLGIEFLVFAGGGISGSAYIGVANEFERRGLLKDIKYFIGSSSGAIMAALLALGATSDFIENTFKNVNIAEFLDVGGRCYNDKSMLQQIQNYKDALFDTIKHFGAARGYKFLTFFEEVMIKLKWSSDTTFLELFHKTGNHLVVTGTSLNTHSTLFFSKSSYPHMKIKDAVHMSMILPFLYQPVLFDDPLCTHGPRIVIDGGILSNLPINACDVTNDVGEILGFNRKVVGFVLVENGKWAEDYKNIDTIFKFSEEIIKSLHSNLIIQQSQQPYFWDRVVAIDVSVDTLQFDATLQDLNNTIEAGKKATKKFLDQRISTISKYGPLPENLFIPNDRLIIQGVTHLSNNLIKNTKVYQTDPDNFAYNKIK